MNRDKLHRKWLGAFLLGAFVAIAFTLFVLVLRKVRVTEGRFETYCNMRGILVALENYHENYKSHPPPTFTAPDGSETVSWRAVVALYASATLVRVDPQEPWDGPTNTRWHGSVDVFSCGRPGNTKTNVMAVVGPNTAFDEKYLTLRASEMDDDTILIVEVAHTDVHWIQPGDFHISKLDADGTAKAIPELDERDFHVGFADGKVWRISSDIPLHLLKDFMTVDGARSNDREIALAPFRIKRRYRGSEW